MARLFKKNREKTTLGHIMDLFGNEVLAAFLTGHLIVESILVQLAALKGKNPVNLEKENFPAKVNA